MHRHHFATSLLICGALAVASAACGTSEEPKSASETASQTAQPANQPMTVEGCLKAGEAADTFVIAAARTAGSDESATYELVGAVPEVNLRDHLGQRVEVSGTMVAQQEIAARTTAVPPAEDRPAGTSGTPRIETKTEIDIKRLSVQSVKPTGEKCEM